MTFRRPAQSVSRSQPGGMLVSWRAVLAKPIKPTDQPRAKPSELMNWPKVTNMPAIRTW